jgi:transposase-like protein
MPKRRRRSFTPQFKAQVVLEVLSVQRSASESARQHKLKLELISRWKDIALEGLEGLFHGDDQRGRDQERIAELDMTSAICCATPLPVPADERPGPICNNATNSP